MYTLCLQERIAIEKLFSPRARVTAHVYHAHALDSSEDITATYRLVMASVIFWGLSFKSVRTTAELFDKTLG